MPANECQIMEAGMFGIKQLSEESKKPTRHVDTKCPAGTVMKSALFTSLHNELARLDTLKGFAALPVGISHALYVYNLSSTL